MEKRKVHSILWDLVAVSVFTALFSLVMPFVCLAPILALTLDFRSGRVSATVTMSVTALAVGGFFYGTLGLLAAGVAILCAVGCHFMKRAKMSHMDGLLYALIGAETLSVAAVFFLTRSAGDLPSLLVEEFKTLMLQNPDSFRNNLAMFAMIAQEGISVDMTAKLQTYTAMDFDKLLSLAEPILLDSVTMLMPCAVFLFGLLAGDAAWLAGGYALRNTQDGESHPSAPPKFSDWAIPRPLAITLLIAYLVTLILPSNASGAMTIAVTLIHIFGWIVFWFLGEAALAFFLERRHVRTFGRWAWSIGLTLVLPGALFFFGLFDTAFRMRENLRRNEEIAKQILEQAQEQARQRHEREASHIHSPYSQEGTDRKDEDEPRDDNDKGDDET